MLCRSSYQNELKTEIILPVKIIAAEKCENPEALLQDSVNQSVIELTKFPVISQSGYVLLDFGEEVQGGALISSAIMEKSSIMRLTFGESVSEALSTLGQKNAGNDHALRDYKIELGNLSTVRTGHTGFRFLKVEAVEGNLPVRGIKAEIEYRDLEWKGSFQSDDELLNQIWKTGAKTVHLNMQEYIWDGIKRDRLVWVGDMHPETSVIAAVFGNTDVVKKSLNMIRNTMKPDEWMNCWYPSYNLWWLKIQLDWYMATGDFDFLLEQKEFLQGMLQHFFSLIHEDGSHDIRPMICDWSSAESGYEPAGFQALLVIGFSAGEELCHYLGLTEEEKLCRKYAQIAAKRKLPYEGNKQIAAMVALSGIDDPKQIAEQVLMKNGAEGLSTFWGYYVLQALAECGEMEAALQMIREYWGAMLKFGATTFWEDFDLKWTENAFGIDQLPVEGMKDIHGDYGRFCYQQFRHSLCHGWAGGPTAFLSSYVLGIHIEEPECRKIRICPQMGNLMEVSGTFPTPYGILSVHHKKDCATGKIISTVDAPKEIEILQ